MKRLCIIYLLAVALFVACDFGMPTTPIDAMLDSIEIQRYDRIESRYLLTGDFSALQQMNIEYPMETRALIEDVLKLGSVNNIDINKKLLNLYQDTIMQTIIADAESEFADMDDLNKELKEAFSKIKKIIPNAEIPHLYAQITALDQSIVVDDKSIGISLDKYLGEDYPIYKKFYDEKQRKTMTRTRIVPDVVLFYLICQYQLRDFDNRTQHERDSHISVLMHITNEITNKQEFNDILVPKVRAYAAKHPRHDWIKTLESQDYPNW